MKKVQPIFSFLEEILMNAKLKPPLYINVYRRIIMKYKTCYNSVCESGYSISVIKSAMQKFLRRRKAQEMKWCVKEMYAFKSNASTEVEVKVGNAIFSNLKNRLIIMMDEELLFTEWAVYLKGRSLVEKGDLESLYKLCDILCESKLLRYPSDVACYYLKAVTGDNPNFNKLESDDVHDSFVKFKSSVEEKNIKNVYYWACKLFSCDEKLEKKVLRRSAPIYLVWDYLLKTNSVKENEKLKKLIEYRMQEFTKDRGEKKMFLIASLSLYFYRDRLDWSIDWSKIESKEQSNLLSEQKITIPEYAIDMHCAEGRLNGKDKKDFALEGSLVVDEDKEYYFREYREFYNECKIKDAQVKKNDAKKKPVKKVVKQITEALEFIPMDEMEFVELCTETTCGGKVMCFVVKYKDEKFVLKEGRRSMNYNKDYQIVDEMKEIFGLNSIGMVRIKSNKIIVKKDKTIKSWKENWEFMESPDVIYTMMKYINAEKFNKVNELTQEMKLEFLKIGLFRGIFMVSDFNTSNVLVSENKKMYSIDEHDMLGKRSKIIGRKNMRFYRENIQEINGIFNDLYANMEEKTKILHEKLKKFQEDKNIESIMNNFIYLKKRFYEEYEK